MLFWAFFLAQTKIFVFLWLIVRGKCFAFGEVTSGQLKAICACIPICKIWKILEMDARYELASLRCIQ